MYLNFLLNYFLHSYIRLPSDVNSSCKKGCNKTRKNKRLNLYSNHISHWPRLNRKALLNNVHNEKNTMFLTKVKNASFNDFDCKS